MQRLHRETERERERVCELGGNCHSIHKGFRFVSTIRLFAVRAGVSYCTIMKFNCTLNYVRARYRIPELDGKTCHRTHFTARETVLIESRYVFHY